MCWRCVIVTKDISLPRPERAFVLGESWSARVAQTSTGIRRTYGRRRCCTFRVLSNGQWRTWGRVFMFTHAHMHAHMHALVSQRRLESRSCESMRVNRATPHFSSYARVCVCARECSSDRCVARDQKQETLAETERTRENGHDDKGEACLCVRE